ncbi:MAG: acyl-CoA dehydrogenase family protein [Saprospiraceae bacterium]|nr:acyl-CoA dehydrogenase family protein [Saprospiraceae bacterium]
MVATKATEPNTETRDEPFVQGGYFVTESAPANELFIAEEFDEEAQLMAETVKEFCIKEIQTPFFQSGRELQVTNPEDKAEVLAILKRAGDLGLCSVSIPEAYEGMGLNFKTNTLISMALSHGLSFATTLGAQTSIGCLPIVYYGNEQQKQKYLPKIASAEYVAAYALTEPQAGSDANAGRTSARLSEDQQHYLLNGQKIWITNGGFADVYIVFAKIDSDKNLSAFIVERNFEGFSVGAEEKKFGIKGSSTVQLFFDNCKVPVENLLGAREEGFKMALTILNGGRIKAGAGGIGGAKFAINKSVGYAKERQQFGKAIGSFGAIQAKLADMAMQVFAAEAACFRTADLIDRKEVSLLAQGASQNEAKIKSISEFAIEASIVKVRGSELVCYALDEAMQIFGGMGYAVETGLGIGYRDARITKIYEGTNEINAMLSVGELSKRALQTKELDLLTAGKRIPAFLLSRLNPFRAKDEVSEQDRLVQGLKYTFLYLSSAAGKKLRKQMIDEQEIIMHLSTILQESYLADSALLKLRKLQLRGGSDQAKLQLRQDMVQLFLYQASNKARQAAFDVLASFAEGAELRRHRRIIKLLLQPYSVNPRTLGRNIAQALINNDGYPF